MSGSIKIWIAVAVVIISVTLVSGKAMAASVDMELVQAAWDGNFEKASLALKNGANPNAVVPVSGWTPLLCASWRGV
ncbi:MAG: ankyrin repeat domain-containing protein, partial [Deltaproteobacteria bacterium]|nr:ankyrin repeat domain-containing protein [Deltaproteobacteria bacterium]